MKSAFKTALIAAIVSAFVAAGAAVATTQTFTLGATNRVDAASTVVNATSTGTTNPVDAPLLTLNNKSSTPNATPLSLVAAPNHTPFKVNSAIKVANLNADQLDGFDSSVFIRKGVAQSAAVSAGGVVDVTNTSSGNGVQGKTAGSVSSGVYGENTSGGGYGVAGRAGAGGYSIYGDNTGGGYAGYFTSKVFVGGALDCSGCVSDSDLSRRYPQGIGQAVAVQPGVNLFLGPPLLGFLRLSYFCPTPTSGDGALVVYNDSGSLANVFVDSGGANPTYQQLAAGGQWQLPAAAAGDSFFIQAQGALGVETIDVATANRSSDCHAQAQALLTS